LGDNKGTGDSRGSPNVTAGGAKEEFQYMANKECRYCDDHKQRGHNYCRRCGYHLRKGLVRYVRKAIAFYTNDKFYGYCGGPKNNCECRR